MAMAEASLLHGPVFQQQQQLHPSSFASFKFSTPRCFFCSFSPLPLTHLRSHTSSSFQIYCNASYAHKTSDDSLRPEMETNPSANSEKNDTGKQKTSGANSVCTADVVRKSRRGRTREALGLHRSKPLETEHTDAERASDGAANSGMNEFKERVQTSETQKSESGSRRDVRAKVQAMIDADIDGRFKRDEDDKGYPLWVDEDDPNWLDEPDEGWGFSFSELFKGDPSIKSKRAIKKDDDDDDVEGLDWDLELDKWSAREIDSTDWTTTVFGDPSPLVVLLFERYGKTAREGYHLLRELEAAVNRIWESHRLPPRLVKINASVEVDLIAAMGAKEFPMILFIKAGKLLHRQTGYYTSDDLMRMIAYFYHGAGRPSCLKKVQAPKSISSTT